MLEKTGSLEREKNGLKDENSLLKNEIKNLKVVPESKNSLQGLKISYHNEIQLMNISKSINHIKFQKYFMKITRQT